MANGLTNPFGVQTTTPFLFGEDPASQEAQRAYGEAAKDLVTKTGDIGLRTIGLVGDIPAAVVNPFLQEGAQYRTQFTPNAEKIPALGYEQFKDIFSTTGDVAKGTADFLGFETDPMKVVDNILQTDNKTKAASANVMDAPITDEERDLFNQGFKAIQAQEERDRMIENSPLSQMTQVLGSLKKQGVSADQRAEIAGRMLAPFLRQGADETRTAAFEQASREREARLAQEEAGRRMQEARPRGEIGGGLGDYMSLARQAGAKGGAVKTMAEQLRTQAEQQAATTQAELETEAKKQDVYQARIDALREEKPDESTAAIGRIDNLISRGILPADKRSEAILSELGLDPNELLGSGIGFDPSTLSAIDKEAYDFAIKNPEDSRSKEILERLGVS